MKKPKTFVDMARSSEEIKEDISPLTSANADKYPWGLRISLTQEELEKLDVDHKDLEVGATYHAHVMMKLVSVSSHETEGGKHNCCVSMQIEQMSIESEDAENEEDDDDQPLKKYGYTKNK